MTFSKFRSTGAVYFRTVSQSTLRPMCRRRWAAGHETSSTSTIQEFGGFSGLDKDCQAGFLVVNTVGDQKPIRMPRTPPLADTGDAKLIEWVHISIKYVPDLDVRGRWRRALCAQHRDNSTENFRKAAFFRWRCHTSDCLQSGAFGQEHRHPRCAQSRVQARLCGERICRSGLLDSYEPERPHRQQVYS